MVASHRPSAASSAPMDAPVATVSPSPPVAVVGFELAHDVVPLYVVAGLPQLPLDVVDPLLHDPPPPVRSNLPGTWRRRPATGQEVCGSPSGPPILTVPTPARTPTDRKRETHAMQDILQALGGGLLGIAILIFAFAWFLAGVLMPWYVYQAARYTRQTRDEVAKTRDVLRLRLDAIQNELRRKG